MVNKPAKGAQMPLQRRLRALRKVLGYEHANTFAQALGVTANAYGNVEAGFPLSTKMMIKISKLCPDVTWEWLQFGNERFLTIDMAQRLRSAEEEIAGTTDKPAARSRPRGRAGRATSASK